MEKNIRLKYGIWLNLRANGIPPATVITIQNQTDSIVELSSQFNEPDNSTPTAKVPQLWWAQNGAEDEGAWAYGSGVILVRW